MLRRGSGLRLFAWYALASAVPVVVLGFGLSSTYTTEMDHRALDQAGAEAGAISAAGIEPTVGSRDLGGALAPSERAQLAKTTAPLLASGSVLRLRLRDRTGTVVFDAAHPDAPPKADHDDDVATAAAGHTVRRLTRLNRDEVDAARQGGARAVEAYLPVNSGGHAHRVVGVLEIYLPYAPIAHAFVGSEHAMMIVIGGGLVVLWLALSVITWSVTRRLRRTAAANEYLALHDTLTGLPNRTLFGERAAHAIAAAGRTGEHVGVAIVDLDRFKEVNDSLGHHNGDRLLAEVAGRLAAQARPGDTVARLGGDEFGVVLADCVDPHAALSALRRVIDREVDVSGLPVSVEASIGYVVAPCDGDRVDELLQRADVAMYLAKHEHAGALRYDAARDHYDAANLALVAELRHAIDGDQLVMHYQPKIALADGRTEAVEALVRWQHPVHGLLGPDRFLPLAEQTDIIDQLTLWVLRRSIRDVRDLAAAADGVAVAVNVSARNLARADFAQRVVRLLREEDVA
ncbi:MAG: diguanylate cyclase, partial [Actinobacteria bacterium]|nr:diguanylate cyclase [Actinomycetota bacterium]